MFGGRARVAHLQELDGFVAAQLATDDAQQHVGILLGGHGRGGVVLVQLRRRGIVKLFDR